MLENSPLATLSTPVTLRQTRQPGLSRVTTAGPRVRKSDAAKSYKGSAIICVRFPRDLLVAMEDAMDSANDRAHVKSGEPYDYTGYIRTAVQDKLNHLARARRSSRKNRKAERHGDDVGAGI